MNRYFPPRCYQLVVQRGLNSECLLTERPDNFVSLDCSYWTQEWRPTTVFFFYAFSGRSNPCDRKLPPVDSCYLHGQLSGLPLKTSFFILEPFQCETKASFTNLNKGEEHYMWRGTTHISELHLFSGGGCTMSSCIISECTWSQRLQT